MRRVFGHDLFLSYSRRDATEYVRTLAMKVREHRPKLSICLDQWAAAPHETTHPKLLREARRSSLFVVVASSGAMISTNVAEEIDEYLKTGRYLLAIDVDGVLASPGSVWSKTARDAIETTKPVHETGDRLTPEKPDPSPSVVTRVLGAVTFETQTQRIRRYAIRTVIGVATIVAAAAVYSRFLVDRANDDRMLADATSRFAGQRAIRARTIADDANAMAIGAAIRAVNADAMALAAERRASTANARATTAGAEAQHKQEIALALQLANESAVLLRQQPQLVERAVEQAIESMARLERRGVRTLGADQALRASAALWPEFTRNDPVKGAGGREALSPHGDRFVVTDDTQILLYDVATGRCDPLPIDSHEPSRGWSAVVFDRDGDAIAAAVREDIPGRAWVHVWDAKTHKPLAVPLRFDGAAVGHLSLGAGGAIVAVALGSEYVVFDVIRHTELGRGKHGSGAIRWLELSPNERLLVTVDKEEVQVREWKVNGQPVVIDTKHPTRFATFAPNGSRIATVDDHDGLVMWDINESSAKRLWAADVPPPFGRVRFSRDGKRIGASRFGFVPGGLRVYDADNGRSTTSIEAHVDEFAFNADASLIATGTNDVAQLWRAYDGRELSRVPHPGNFPLVEFRDDGSIVSVGRGGRLRVWRRSARLPSGDFIPTAGEAETIAFEPGSNALAIVSDPFLGGSHELHRVDAAGNWRRCGALVPVQRAIAFTRDGLLITGGRDGKVRERQDWCSEAARVRVIEKIDGDEIRSIAISDDGSSLVATAGKIARVIENWRGAKRTRDLPHPSLVVSCALLANGDVVTGAEDGRVRVWRGTQIRRELLHGSRVDHLAASKDGRFIVAGGSGVNLHVWDLESTSMQPVVLGHESAWSVAIEPTGRYIVTATADGMAHVRDLWDRGAAHDLVRLDLASGSTLVTFSPDGKWLGTLTNRADPFIVITPWQPKEMIEAACSSLGQSRVFGCRETMEHYTAH